MPTSSRSDTRSERLHGALSGAESGLVQRRTVLQGALALAGAIVLPGGTAVAWAGEAPARSSAAPRAAAGARPWVLWYWINANITREGIAADLDAMHAAGIEGAFIFNIGGADDSTLVDPPVESQTSQWWDLVRFAIRHAGELGMTVGMNVCDGWGTAGGAWIAPEMSAHELVWTEAVVEGGSRRAMLAQPTMRHDYYRDVAVYAFPLPAGWSAGETRQPIVTASWAVQDVQRVADPTQGDIVVDTEEEGWLTYSFERPFTLRSVTVRNPAVQVLPFLSVGFNGAANGLAIEASDDGMEFRPVHTMRVPKLGWQSNLPALTHSIPPTTARHFRFVYRPQAIQPVSGDGKFSITRRLQLSSLALSSRAVVDQLPVRSAQVWGIAEPLSDMLLPQSECISPEDILDLTDRLAPDGTLQWNAPPGRWAVLRMGMTTNGVVTSPSGRAGGLECDKFDPAAVELQFDGWFGEALRQAGPELAGQVLKVLNMDSWESHSQNWSPRFAREFRERRGYDSRRYLPVMAGVPIGSASLIERFLFDVRRTIGDLLRDCFFATLGRLAREHDCLLSAQQTNASFPSDGMQHFQDVDIPNGEFWKGMPASDKPSDIREAVSAARLYGKDIVGAEAFTGQLDWSEHPFSFKAQGDEHFCIGINRMVLHVWAHQAFPGRHPGVTLYGYGSFFSRTQPWWPMAGAWLDYLARCQELLQAGRPVADICYYTGEDIPSRAYLPAALDPPLPAGYAYDSINAHALMTLAKVRDGRITLPSGASYALMVLPKAVPMTLAVASKLRDLVAAGATIVGTRPVTSPSLADDSDSMQAAEAILDELWGGASESTRGVAGGPRHVAADDLAAVLASLSVPPDLEISGTERILWAHRRDDGRDVYFLSNQGQRTAAFGASWRASMQRPVLYDAVQNRWTVPVTTVRESRTELHIELPEAGSIFVVFGAPAPRISSIGSRACDGSMELVREGTSLMAETRASGRWRIRADTDREAVIEAPRLPAAVALDGPWNVQFEGGSEKIARLMARLRSWHEEADPSIRFYSGAARYSTTFRFGRAGGFPGDLPGDLHWLLDPGGFANTIRVIVNGMELGVLWVPGTTLDATRVLRPGTNSIDIIVANTWRNRLVGDRDSPPAERSTWILANTLGRSGSDRIAAPTELLPAGLFGPVRLVPLFRSKVSL